MGIKEFVDAANDVLKNYYAVTQSLKSLDEELRLLRSETVALRTELSGLEGRVARLEESRLTIAAEMRAVIAETVADLRVENARAEAEQYRRFVDAQAALREASLRLPAPEKDV